MCPFLWPGSRFSDGQPQICPFLWPGIGFSDSQPQMCPFLWPTTKSFCCIGDLSVLLPEDHRVQKCLKTDTPVEII